ncbi:MAG TPA: protein phosphatase 2C domain-containing protein [Chthoniobacteraceae bacterium]|nr:protein phosphatase 2C domain-containing protein [Chthoniobacteraceae bacterium]
MKVTVTTHVQPRCATTAGADACAAHVEGETVIAVVADGVGAARAGAEASRRIVDAIVSQYPIRPREWSPSHALNEFARLLNRTLYQESIARFDAPELVSTLSVAVIEGDRLFGLNVGDSRVYLSRAGTIEQLSVDHNDPIHDHVLNRAMGMAADLQPHAFERELHDGDVALLCSDGLTRILSNDALITHLEHRSGARTLVNVARHEAGDCEVDDMTAVVIDIDRKGTMRAVSQQSLSIPDTLEKGNVIDGYELLRPFTGTDRVWLAQKDDRRWTLKFAPLEARDDQAYLERFVKESWNASRAEGDAFVTAFVPERATARYYVQEFVEAPSLKLLLKSRRLAIDEAVNLGTFLCDATSRLLRLDLVHGDLKPENILAVADYDRIRFKLVDLGSSTEVFSVTSRAGTASYLAPERFHGTPISERTEIFAIGVTLYEALTHRLPFGEIERFQIPTFHYPRNPSSLNPNIPAWLDHVVLRALSIEPERRYRHYSELAFDLAHPDRVEPFYHPDAPLLTRDPLAFYRAGFWILLAATIYLTLKLLTQH